jgi:cytochrome c oxidase cbb3-type subunit 2
VSKTVGFIVAAIGILVFATILLIAIPSAQLAQIAPEKDLKPYTAQELRGRTVYVSEGCVYCHSQQPRDPSQAPDGLRGWGRPSTPGDYAYDYPHQLGTMRTGPDLLNIGVRQPSDDWHHAHLFQPRALVEWSIMPSYRYLYEVKDVATENDFVVKLPEKYAVKGKFVVAKQEALDLVAYLKALKRNYKSDQLQFRAPRTAEAKQ